MENLELQKQAINVALYATAAIIGFAGLGVMYRLIKDTSPKVKLHISACAGIFLGVCMFSYGLASMCVPDAVLPDKTHSFLDVEYSKYLEAANQRALEARAFTLPAPFALMFTIVGPILVIIIMVTHDMIHDGYFKNS